MGIRKYPRAQNAALGAQRLLSSPRFAQGDFPRLRPVWCLVDVQVAARVQFQIEIAPVDGRRAPDM